MPKRPSAIEISSDSQIICGDKFGDVYSLPLIQDASWVAQKPAPKARNKPAANELTVHSQRNLEALRDQQKQIENVVRKYISKPIWIARVPSSHILTSSS